MENVVTRQTRFQLFGTTAILALFVLLAGGSEQTSGPTLDQVKVVSYAAEGEIYTDSGGNPDYGKKVKVLLKNRGVPATITVSVVLSCSEGRWKKEASTKLENDESGYAYMNFPEPSISSSDIIISKVEVVRVQ